MIIMNNEFIDAQPRTKQIIGASTNICVIILVLFASFQDKLLSLISDSLKIIQ